MPKISDPTKLPTEILVAHALALKAQIAERDAELKLLAAALIERGEGKHSDADGNTITVVAATEPGTKLCTLDETQAATARELCGADFSKLFAKELCYVPQTGFLDRMEVLIKGKARAALLGLATEETRGKSAYLIYPKK